MPPLRATRPEFRTVVFNPLYKTNVRADNVNGSSAALGTITATYAPRQIQFGLKLSYRLLRFVLAVLVALSGGGPVPGTAVDPSLDDTVVAAALDDLVTYKGKDTPVFGPFSHKKPLAFAVTPARYELTVEGVLHRQDEKLWEGLTPAEVAASREAAESLVQRLRTLPPDARFTISDKRVRLRDPRAEEQPEPIGFDRTTKAWPPGYSKDGQLAIVMFSIPWSIHSADATYVLMHQNGGWKVRVRQFVFYL